MRTADSPGVDVFTSELVRIDLPKLTRALCPTH